jgi:hypothetical protein
MTRFSSKAPSTCYKSWWLFWATLPCYKFNHVSEHE